MIEWLQSIELEAPQWLLILPLPLLVYFLVPAYRTKQSAIKVPFFQTLVEAMQETPTTGARQLKAGKFQRGILVLFWLLMVISLAKPTLLGKPEVREQMGRDVMVVVDLSGSMAEEDFVNQSGQTISRLDATKEVLSEFASERQGDRLGLILFGDAAFVQTPFTADHDAWLELLQQAEVAMAGQSTHLGDAMGLAIKLFEESSSSQQEKVAIVLTDGNDTGSFVEPIDAAKVAAAKEVRLHVIAMGDPRTVGENALDMAIIEQVATTTGGQAFEALDRSSLHQAYQTIDQLEPELYQSTTYRPKQSIHHYFIGTLVILYIVFFGHSTFKRRQQSLALANEKGEH